MNLPSHTEPRACPQIICRLLQYGGEFHVLHKVFFPKSQSTPFSVFERYASPNLEYVERQLAYCIGYLRLLRTLILLTERPIKVCCNDIIISNIESVHS